MTRLTRDPVARAATLRILARGSMTAAEAARLAGVSTQLVHWWSKSAGLDWRARRERVLAVAWQKELSHGQQRVGMAGRPER